MSKNTQVQNWEIILSNNLSLTIMKYGQFNIYIHLDMTLVPLHHN